MKKILYYSFTIIVLVLIIINVFLYFDNKKVLEVYNVNADVNITNNKTAFKLTNDSTLHFGSIKNTFSSNRFIKIKNTYPFDIKVFLTHNGKSWVYIDNSSFLLKPNESKTITLTVNPYNETLGFYEWNFTVLIKKN